MIQKTGSFFNAQLIQIFVFPYTIMIFSLAGSVFIFLWNKYPLELKKFSSSSFLFRNIFNACYEDFISGATYKHFYMFFFIQKPSFFCKKVLYFFYKRLQYFVAEYKRNIKFQFHSSDMFNLVSNFHEYHFVWCVFFS